MSKAILNSDGTFRMLVPDDASTAPDQTRVWVPTEPPGPGDGEVVEESAPLVGPVVVTQQWTVRAKTADELRKTWTCLDFIASFTPDERAAVRTYAPDLMEMLLAAHEIESDNPLTLYGLGELVTAGIITEARKGELLA